MVMVVLVLMLGTRVSWARLVGKILENSRARLVKESLCSNVWLVRLFILSNLGSDRIGSAQLSS